MLVINSAHLASQAAADNDRWLPLFWALDYYKDSQEENKRKGDWKIVAKGIDGPWELYDMSTDRSEQHNLAASKPEVLRSMAVQWKEADDLYERQREAAPSNGSKLMPISKLS